MQLKPTLIALVSTIAPFLTLLPPVTSVATAQQGIQYEGNLGTCLSRVVGQEPGSQVNMRSEPSLDSDIQNYVLVGQTVTNLVLAATGNIIRNQDDQGNTWMYVAYNPRNNRNSNVVGWVRADFLRDIGCQP